MIPNLEAEIIPTKSIADITLGLDFEHFKANSKYDGVSKSMLVNSVNRKIEKK